MTARLRRHPVSRRWVLIGLIGVALPWWATMLSMTAVMSCPLMPLAMCTVDAAPAIAIGLVLALGARTTWLGIGATRGIEALDQARLPPELAAAAASVSTAPVMCLATSERVAFCAGLWRPRLYVSVGAVAGLARDELEAVLAHEDAHARRRDPLRGLVRRAGADVLFFAPLASRWDARRRLHAELIADRRAVHRAGAPALAGALLSLADAPQPAGEPAFGASTGDALQARIDALTDHPGLVEPIPLRDGAMTLLGSLAMLGLALCAAPLALLLGL